jgi:hypothetical protein
MKAFNMIEPHQFLLIERGLIAFSTEELVEIRKDIRQIINKSTSIYEICAWMDEANEITRELILRN